MLIFGGKSASNYSNFIPLLQVILLSAGGVFAFSPHVTLSSDFVTVYNYTRERCPNGQERLSYDVADGPPRIFRSPKTHLFLQFSSVSSGSRGQEGTSIENLEHSCKVYANSTNSMIPYEFSSHEMPFSPWVSEEDGVVYALTDMEFHNTTQGFGGLQLYTATTLFKSLDGGYTFHHAVPPPYHVVAAMPDPPANAANAKLKVHVPAFRAVGNIIPHDRYYYAMITALWKPGAIGLQKQGRCIMRTDNISDPASWKGWDGQAFAAGMQSFWWEHPDPSKHTCQPVLPSNMTHSTLFYSTVYERYVVLGTQPKWMYFSHDLVHWENGTEVMGNTGTRDEYSFVIDPSQPGPNYYEVGKEAYFFYEQFIGPWPAGRNIIRRKLHFGPAD